MAPWGGIFDFNFDGKTSWDEQAFGLMICKYIVLQKWRILKMSFLRCAQFIRLIVQYSGQKSNFWDFWDQEIEFS